MSQKDQELDNKKMIAAVAPNIFISFVIIGIIWIFNPGFPGLLMIISSIVLIQHIKNRTKPRAILYSLIHTGFYVTIIYQLWILSGNYGLVGYLVFLLGLAAWRMYVNRKIMMQGMRQIETMIFGKSLDKKNWQETKPRLPKIKRGKA